MSSFTTEIILYRDKRFFVEVFPLRICSECLDVLSMYNPNTKCFKHYFEDKNIFWDTPIRNLFKKQNTLVLQH